MSREGEETTYSDTRMPLYENLRNRVKLFSDNHNRGEQILEWGQLNRPELCNVRTILEIHHSRTPFIRKCLVEPQFFEFIRV